MSREAEKKLMGLLDSIFADNLVTVSERSSLLAFTGGDELAPDGIERVFRAFVEKKWGEVLADGRVTDHEKLMLRRILEELALPEKAIPLQLRMALGL